MIGTFEGLIAAAKEEGAKRIAIPVPTQADVDAAAQAAKAGLVTPCFVGDMGLIGDMLGKCPVSKFNHDMIGSKSAAGAMSAALSLVREGQADILAQGGYDRNLFLESVLAPGKGILEKKTASYISVFQLIKSNKLIFATDTFLNDCPKLTDKQVILENAIELAARLGIAAPKVAVLAAIEQVNPGIPSTLDAAILSKMSERKQFGRAIVEGPLDIDCSLSHVAAERKGLKSPVTGKVDIYLVPEVDTGYLLAEMLVFFGKMRAIGLLAGFSAPVLVNLLFIAGENRVAEMALACLACRKGGNNG